MRRAAVPLGLGITLAALCCAPATRPPPVVKLGPGGTPAPVDKETDAASVILVWGREAAKQGESEEDRRPVTYRLDGSDERGSVLGLEPGIVIAARGGEWAWTTTEIDVPTLPCDDARPRGEGKATRAELLLKGGSERQAVVVPEAPEAPQANEIRHWATVVGSVGPYLFVHESTYEYGCGAHGGVLADFSAWDAQQGKAIHVLDEVPDGAALVAEGQRLLNEAEGPDGSDEKPELSELRPTYDARGKLGLMALMPRFACYTCSDGQWSSYSRSVLVQARLSPRLAPYAEAPAAVRAFLSAHPTFTMQGFSRR